MNPRALRVQAKTVISAGPGGNPSRGPTRQSNPMANMPRSAEGAIQAAWNGMGRDVAMVVVLDPFPRWRSGPPGTSLPTLGGCQLLAARWTGAADAADAYHCLLRVLDHQCDLTADLAALAGVLPEDIELLALRATDVLGPWPTYPPNSLQEATW